MKKWLPSRETGADEEPVPPKQGTVTKGCPFEKIVTVPAGEAPS